MDKFSKKKRSEIMRKVGQKNTVPEMAVRKILHALGYRFRLHRKQLPGTPDIFLPKYRTAIFVNGCFWHGHSCPRGKLPDTRKEFWKDKITTNCARDKKTEKNLLNMGYRVLVVWECEVKDKEILKTRLESFLPREKLSGSTAKTK